MMELNVDPKSDKIRSTCGASVHHMLPQLRQLREVSFDRLNHTNSPTRGHDDQRDVPFVTAIPAPQHQRHINDVTGGAGQPNRNLQPARDSHHVQHQPELVAAADRSTKGFWEQYPPDSAPGCVREKLSLRAGGHRSVDVTADALCVEQQTSPKE